jgi:hypothetical protein
LNAVLTPSYLPSNFSRNLKAELEPSPTFDPAASVGFGFFEGRLLNDQLADVGVSHTGDEFGSNVVRNGPYEPTRLDIVYIFTPDQA